MATDVPIERVAPRSVSLPHGAVALTGLAATAGLIHLVASVEHFGIDWGLGAFFVLVAVAQFAAAWLIYRDAAAPRLLALVAVGSVAVALLWVFSRTTGLPFGPDDGRVAKVGVGDTIATLLELAFAALAGLVLWRGHQRVAWLSGPLGVRLTYTCLTLAVMMAAFGGHEH
jgi:uncharacterized membrane protein